MKSHSFMRFGLAGIFPILVVVLIVSFLLQSSNSMVGSGAKTQDDTQKVSVVHESEYNASSSTVTSRSNSISQITGSSELSKPVNPVTGRNAADTSNPASLEQQPIFLEGGYWLENGWDGNWRAHR